MTPQSYQGNLAQPHDKANEQNLLAVLIYPVIKKINTKQQHSSVVKPKEEI